MHDEALAFIRRHAHLVRRGAGVIEVGSFDRNGTVRDLFPQAGVYLGIDIEAGPGVDEVVSDPLTWVPPWQPWAVITTETFEHVADWPRLLDAMAGWLCPGGVLIATMAGPQRKPHAANGDRGGPKPGEHYANVNPYDLADALRIAGFTSAYVHTVRDGMDVQASAWLPEPGCGRIACPRS